jgi:uncharacterized protein (TIGR03435 family)
MQAKLELQIMEALWTCGLCSIREVGLRLDSRKVPIEVLVIDSAERPSAN